MKPEPIAPTDPASLKISNDPLPSHRAKPGQKYESIFSSMKAGQCLVCEPNEVSRLANALRKWIDDNNADAHVRSMKNYPKDRMGRVWKMAGKLQTEVASK